VAYVGGDHVQEAAPERNQSERRTQQEKMAHPKRKMAHQKRAQLRK
jgi:hypothetical protein